MPEQGREKTFPVLMERNPKESIGGSTQFRPFCSKVSSIQPNARGLPALSHIHDHPVFGIDILSNQILKHDKSFHEEVLQRTKEWLEENWGTCPS